MKCVIKVKEHEGINIYNTHFDENILDSFDECFKKEDPKFLGLHRERKDGIKLKSFYYIGYRWLNKDKGEYICVEPKENVDYLKMFKECLEDNVVSSHLDKTYKIFFDEEWIEISEDNRDYITPFLIIHFLSIVKKISKKGLKKGYVKISNNLVGKIKEKVLIKENIKINISKNKKDRNYCNYQIYTQNCLENQILKTALIQCSRFLYHFNNENLVKLLKFNLGVFKLIDTRNISNNDFLKIKHSPFYYEYKEALKLAKLIFKRLGFSIKSSSRSLKKIPPFYINMPELFERYVEVKLRKKFGNNVKANYDRKDNYTNLKLRPDFIINHKNLIIDAKYKFWDTDDNNVSKKDLQQLALYGRVSKLRNNNNKEPKLIFIYPLNKEYLKQNCKLRKIKDFSYMYKLGIEIPMICTSHNII